jgi:hypothetical protein
VAFALLSIRGRGVVLHRPFRHDRYRFRDKITESGHIPCNCLFAPMCVNAWRGPDVKRWCGTGLRSGSVKDVAVTPLEIEKARPTGFLPGTDGLKLNEADTAESHKRGSPRLQTNGKF